jgi:hypothetical protein
MTHRRPLCITVDLEDGADPLRGTLETPDTQPRQFWGWLQLIQAIEDAIAPDTPPTIAQRMARRQDTQTHPASQEDSDEQQGT